ncbi:RNA polymerase sigma factor [Bacillus salacetis]|uniref:RNA polymerase sigma factor n=1 Tax=Bacillus salacetis TaxID=2315464 RepID=UPI003BA07D5B
MTQEEKWIKAIQKRSNEQAANQLIHKYYSEIYGFVYKQTMDQELTKDLTQEIFISMLRSLHNFNGRAAFRTWLYKIANSRMIDHYRSKYYQQQRKTVWIDESHHSMASTEFTFDLEAKEEVEIVLKLLSQFKRELQQIVSLKIYGDCTFSEIAASLEMPESTVKTKYYAVIRKLKYLVKENEDE